MHFQRLPLPLFRMILNNFKALSCWKMNTKYKNIAFWGLAMLVLVMGCRKDKLKYDIPTTYNFENVSYSGQTQRMNMLDEMVSYMETARTTGTALDAQVLKDMFENENDPFTFTSTKQLKNKVFLGAQDMLSNVLDSIAVMSTSTSAASNGVAGVATSLDGSEHFLLDANGFDQTEIFEKGIMGAVFYYQTVGYYHTDAKIGPDVDNETIEPGKGTDMQHHWDEGLGYFGIGLNFPADLSGIRYWGKLCNDRDALMTTNVVLADAFIKGRAAINNDDHDTKSDQVIIIRETWERVIAGSAIHELNEAKEHLSDDALRNHEISEAIGFIRALSYNPVKVITDDQINTLISSFGSNLYTVALQTIENARNTLATVYQLETIKDQL